MSYNFPFLSNPNGNKNCLETGESIITNNTFSILKFGIVSQILITQGLRDNWYGQIMPMPSKVR